MPDRASVLAALDTVIDPRSGQGLVAAGLVQGLVVGPAPEGLRAGFVLEVAAGDTAAVNAIVAANPHLHPKLRAAVIEGMQPPARPLGPALGPNGGPVLAGP